MLAASFSFGIRIPPALRHVLGMDLFCHAVLMRPQRNLQTSGVFLYTLYGTQELKLFSLHGQTSPPSSMLEDRSQTDSLGRSVVECLQERQGVHGALGQTSDHTSILCEVCS